MALGHQRNGQARSDPATPDDDHVHATAQHATRHCAKRTPEQVRVCSYAGAVTPGAGTRPPVPLSGAAAATIPERRRYRIKNKMLGAPLVNEQLSSERLGRPTALGVLAPDCISSTAYGSEQIMIELLPAAGMAAFALLLPITGVILLILVLVAASYRQVVMVYTRSGGSYVVARENFGPRVAQIAAASLLIDYVVTVAVQCAAGTVAVVSAAPALGPYSLEITVGVVLLMITPDWLCTPVGTFKVCVEFSAQL